MADCKTIECNNPHRALGYCSNHYKQFKKYGHTLSKEEIHIKRSEVAKTKKNCLGKHWKIKDTSNMTGRVPKTAFKKGVSPWCKGLTGWMTEKHVEAIKKANTKYTSEETLTNKQLRFRFRTLRRHVLLRDNDTCQVCQKVGGELHVDHIQSWSEYPELRFEMDNCRTLCMGCHYYVTYKRKLQVGKIWGNTFNREIN